MKKTYKANYKTNCISHSLKTPLVGTNIARLARNVEKALREGIFFYADFAKDVTQAVCYIKDGDKIVKQWTVYRNA